MITLPMVKGHNVTVDAVIRVYSQQAGETVNLTITVVNGAVVTNVATTMFGLEPSGANVFTARAGDMFVIDGTVHVLTDDFGSYPTLTVVKR